MTITKRIFVYIITIITLLGLYFIYTYFVRPVAKAPTITKEVQLPEIPTSTSFRGPTNQPLINGPSGPPPR